MEGRWFKESRLLEVVIAKHGGVDTLDAETLGHHIAATAGLTTAAIVACSPDAIVMRRIVGETAFAFLTRSRDDSTRRARTARASVLHKIFKDIRAFQQKAMTARFREELAAAGATAYPVGRLMRATQSEIEISDPELAAAHASVLESVAECYRESSVVPFGDFTPKNMIIDQRRVGTRDELAAPSGEFDDDCAERLTHFDFRSTLEMVPRDDDALSVLLHDVLTPAERSHWTEQAIRPGSEAETSATTVVRAGRLYGRRLHYRRRHPGAFAHRYEGESMAHYRAILHRSIDEWRRVNA